MLEETARQQTPHQHWVHEHFTPLWQSIQRDIVVEYLYINLWNLGKNSNESSIFSEEEKLDISITKTHQDESQKVKLANWGARSRANGQPLLLGISLPDLELPVSPTCRREDANVLPCSW